MSSLSRSQLASQMSERKSIATEQQEQSMTEINLRVAELEQKQRDTQKLFIRLRKDIEAKTSDSTIAQLFTLINAGIEADPALIKLLKTREFKEDTSPLRNSAWGLSRKLCQLSQAISLIANNGKASETALNAAIGKAEHTAQQNANRIEEALREEIHVLTENTLSFQEKLETELIEVEDRLQKLKGQSLIRQAELQVKVQQRTTIIASQAETDKLKKQFSQMLVSHRQTLLVDPQRVRSLENDLAEKTKSLSDSNTELSTRLSLLHQALKGTTVKKEDYEVDSLNIEKKLLDLIASSRDAYQHLKKVDTSLSSLTTNTSYHSQRLETQQTELSRVNKVLLSMQIGQQFQKMLQKMNPEQIMAQQSMIQDLIGSTKTHTHDLQLLSRKIDGLFAKSEVQGVLVPNFSKPSLDKEQLETAIDEYLQHHNHLAKLQKVENMASQGAATIKEVVSINRRLSRLTKETDTHSVKLELKALQQYIKMEICSMKERCQTIDRSVQLLIESRSRPYVVDRNKRFSAEKLQVADVTPTRRVIAVSSLSLHRSPSALKQ